LLSDMVYVRQIVEQALSLRQDAGLKVRQPLASITLKDRKLYGKEELSGLLLDEINVKKILFDASLPVPARLDVHITDELVLEGRMRELVRGIQEKRKHDGFVPDERVCIYIETDTKGEALVRRYMNELTVLLRATDIELRKDVQGVIINDGRTTYTVAIES
jgi:isoleucyl-tRNA synthetase